MNAKQVLIDVWSQVQQDDEVVVILNREMYDGTTEQYVVRSEMDFIRALGILESAKQVMQEEEWVEWKHMKIKIWPKMKFYLKTV